MGILIKGPGKDQPLQPLNLFSIFLLGIFAVVFTIFWYEMLFS